MDTSGSIRPLLLLLVSISLCVVTGAPIDCGLGSDVDLGELAEEYEGDLEVVTGIPAGIPVSLLAHLYPEHLEFLEMIFTPGETTATVRTKKPLDADVLDASGSTLYYAIVCTDPSLTTHLGAEVLRVQATDADITPENNRVTFSIEPAPEDFNMTDSGIFILKNRLNYNVVSRYNFIVTASDNWGLNSTATVLIEVEDFDNLNPSFSHNMYKAFIQENQSGPFRTIEPEQIKAQDEDTGINMTLTYSISEVFPDQYESTFSIDSSSGVVSVETPIDREKMTTEVILVSIKACQTDDSSKTANAVVSVTVEDVNDNAPQFDQNSYSVSLMENSPVDDIVFRVTVTDQDQGGFEGSLRILPESVPFSIDPDGTVRVNDSSALDRETTESFTFQVVAVDQATDGLSSTAQLNITVLDYNDNAPQFPEIPDPLQISEGDYTEAAPGEVFSIIPTDADVGLNGEVTVSLASPHPLFRFREDGMLLAVGSLDRESRETYELIIKASDKGSPQRESFTTVRVNLTDVNDNRPEFSSSSYVSSILLKDAVEGKLLLTLSATDRDVGSNGLITYSFLAGPSTYLALNNETGAVTLTSDLADITEDTTVELTAMAEDHGQSPLNSTASVMVNLRVSNTVDAVDFSNCSYSFILPENQPARAAVGRVFATSGSDLYNVTYSLKTHTDLFSISTDGAIQTRVTLDKEEKEQYILDVEAVDTRTPPTSAVAKVTVQVEDVNEYPYFPIKEYNGSVFSIAPYRTPIVQVQASDPDVCGSSQLVYSMSIGRPHFNVEPSTGLVYWASVAGLNESKLDLEVQVTDLNGLQAVVKVEVEVRASTSGDKVTLWLSLPADSVEEHRDELETALGEVLGYTVKIIGLSGTDGEHGSLVSIIATDVNGNVISSEELTRKINSQADAVEKALAEVFGQPVAFAVDPGDSPRRSDQTIIIVVGVLLVLSMLGLTLTSVFIIRNKRKEKKHKDEDTKSRDIPLEFNRSGSHQNRNEETEKTRKDEDTNSRDIPLEFKRSGSYQNRFKKKKKKQNKETDSEQFDLPSVKF